LQSDGVVCAVLNVEVRLWDSDLDWVGALRVGRVWRRFGCALSGVPRSRVALPCGVLCNTLLRKYIKKSLDDAEPIALRPVQSTVTNNNALRRTETDMADMKLMLETVLGDLRLVADGQSASATARASIREAIPLLFPESPTQAEIDAVVNSEDWQEFDGKARRIFAEAWTTAPRMVKFDSDGDAESYEPTAADLDLWVADKKTAKAYGLCQTAIRKAIQAYVRVSVKQNITDFIPEASDAAETVTAPALPDPTQVLAMVTEALIVLSEHKKDAALALLNGLDALVTVSRKPLAEGKALARKA
jgi:hypothetical protein